LAHATTKPLKKWMLPVVVGEQSCSFFAAMIFFPSGLRSLRVLIEEVTCCRCKKNEALLPAQVRIKLLSVADRYFPA